MADDNKNAPVSAPVSVVSESRDHICLSWPECRIADGYVLYGIDGLFGRRPIMESGSPEAVVDRNGAVLGGCVGFQAAAVRNGSAVWETDPMLYPLGKLEKIDLVVLDAPLGRQSLHFVSGEHYDLYRVFDSSGACLAETEDCVFVGEFGKGFHVEGYAANAPMHGTYILKAVSQDWDGGVSHFECKKGCPDVSVVIPVYNAGMFLIRAVQSVLASTLHDIEVILVDDCSQDPLTKEVLEWYGSRHGRVRVAYRDVNGGVCAARNMGISLARGRYTALMDNDDIVHPYMYERLLAVADADDMDVVIAQCIMREEVGAKQLVLSAREHDNIIRMHSFKEVMDSRGKWRNIYFVAIWNKIVKTPLARSIRFHEDLPYYEDTAYTTPLYSFVKEFALVKDAYYIWDKRKQKTVGTASTTHYQTDPERIWSYYILSYVSSLFIGNQDSEIAAVYKFDMIKFLLSKYRERNYSDPIKNVFRGMLKYFVKEYGLPVGDLASGNEDERKSHAEWLKILASKAKPWDGRGEIPKEYYA